MFCRLVLVADSQNDMVFPLELLLSAGADIRLPIRAANVRIQKVFKSLWVRKRLQQRKEQFTRNSGGAADGRIRRRCMPDVHKEP